MSKLLASLSFFVLVPAAVAQCILAPGSTTVATSASIADTIYPAQPIGFPFPLNGQTYTDIHISDHGFAFLSNGGVPTVPAGGALTYNALTADFIGNGPCISLFWADANLGNIGVLSLESSATECTVTWTDQTTFFALPPAFTIQMTLFPTGEVVMRWDANTNNYGSTFTPNAIVGITPGAPLALPAMSDLSTGPITSDPTVFEDFQALSSFDLAGTSLQFIPTNPGWVVIPLGPPTGCAGVQAYGTGCVSSYKSFYELMSPGGFDLSGTTITLLRQPNGYVALDSIPGTLLPPSPSATVVASGLDIEETVTLSGPMPVAGGTTTQLTVCSNGRISLSALGNGIDWTPDVATFLGFLDGTISPAWHDYNNTVGGSITFEESGGFAYVTWNDVVSYGATAPGDTFQVQFELSTGNITIVYQTIQNVGNGYLVGYKASGMAGDRGGNDLSADLANTIEIGDADVLGLSLGATLPVLGSTWDLTTTNVDAVSPIAITFFGGGALNPGLPLTSIGLNAPGCSAYVNSPFVALSAVNSAGTAVLSLPIPSSPGLAGTVLAAQSLCLTLANGANVLTTNGVVGTLGN